MDGAISDNSPKVLLHPDALPQLHSIYPVREEEPSSEDVLSTVDIAALKVGYFVCMFCMITVWLTLVES